MADVTTSHGLPDLPPMVAFPCTLGAVPAVLAAVLASCPDPATATGLAWPMAAAAVSASLETPPGADATTPITLEIPAGAVGVAAAMVAALDLAGSAMDLAVAVETALQDAPPPN